MQAHEQSQKIRWDNYNITETLKKEGRRIGRTEEKTRIAKELKKNGASKELIAESTGLSEEQIKRL